MIYNPYVTEPVTETKLGSNCTGSDGDTNRTLTLTNTASSLHTYGFSIFVNGTALHEGSGKDFTRSGNVITFLNKVWDTDNIQLNYFKR